MSAASAKPLGASTRREGRACPSVGPSVGLAVLRPHAPSHALNEPRRPVLPGLPQGRESQGGPMHGAKRMGAQPERHAEGGARACERELMCTPQHVLATSAPVMRARALSWRTYRLLLCTNGHAHAELPSTGATGNARARARAELMHRAPIINPACCGCILSRSAPSHSPLPWGRQGEPVLTHIVRRQRRVLFTADSNHHPSHRMRSASAPPPHHHHHPIACAVLLPLPPVPQGPRGARGHRLQWRTRGLPQGRAHARVPGHQCAVRAVGGTGGTDHAHVS